MTTREKIEAVIRRYFYQMAGGKLDDGPDGWLFDGDSNWGFEPLELAAEIEREIAHSAPNLGVNSADERPTDGRQSPQTPG